MKKTELMKRYEDEKKCGEEITGIFLVIHMPTGEQETIMNPNIEEKLKYIDRTYNDDLVHCSCKDIYIEEVCFFVGGEPGMLFSEAYELMKEGAKVKLPSWGGYWYWDNEKKTIMMHTKDGKELDIRQTDRPEYTFDNICSGDWIIADEENCPELGGESLFSFAEAIKYLKRGMKVARKGWNGKGMFLFLATDIEVTTKADLSCVSDLKGELTIPSIVMKTADNHFCVGWLASQADMLAEDWVFAE